jgi:hypothetical protein
MASEDPGRPLSAPEFQEMVRLLARYAQRELDRFDLWKFHTSYGPVHMQIGNALPDGWPEDSDKLFTTIWPLPTHLRGDRRGGVPMFLVKSFWASGPCPLSLLVNFGVV